MGQKPLTNDGNIFFTAQDVDSIALLFEFSPERETKIVMPVKDHNYFEFRFQPWVMEVFFRDFELNIEAAGLAGPHPLLTGPSYQFIKS